MAEGPGRAGLKPVAALSHVPQLVQSRHLLHRVHGSSLYGRFNTWLALKVTNAVGSMSCAYLFALLALISLPAAIASRSVIVIVAWIAQTFLQLVLLSVIIVGQKVLQAAADARAEADHVTLTALHEINKHQVDILERLDAKA